ncbi:MAG TPA: sulfite exporter TauE/SafE family protein [Paludibacteraceae bacterium]|nr:sulfite exporter TauE/SafE family protein [Paludibacteraceae bacterium]
MTDFFNTLLSQAESPLWITILLGVVFALDPCAMLTNIAAISYIGKDLDKKKVFTNGLWYTLGRTTVFGIMGIALIILLRTGANLLHISNFFAEYSEILLIPFFIIMGTLLFFPDIFPSLTLSISSDKFNNRMSKNNWGSFLMGALLSLTFCPTNAMIFFGMLLPTCATTSTGWLLLIVFALIVSLPVILIAWIIAFSVGSASKFYKSMKNAGKWARWITGGLFIAIGIFFFLEHCGI